jgi:peptidoglycan/LPS O-acetylase OafA/YrhL
MYVFGYVFLHKTSFFLVYKNIDSYGFFSLVFSNIFIFGQDWIMFTGVRDGVFQLVTNFRQSEILVWTGLLVPQAWTIGVELSFYLIAPFVLGTRKIIYVLLAISLTIRACLILAGLGFSDPWTYRFFPAELALFLFGALSHQILRPFYSKLFGVRLFQISKIATAFVFTYCFIFFLLPFRNINTLLLISVFIITLPLLFVFQSNVSWDRKIGDLSYPIYISHFVVIHSVGFVLKRVYSGDFFILINSFIVVFVTLLVSFFIEKFVSERIELVRTKLKSR